MQMGLFDFLFGKKKPKADMKPIFFPLSGYSPVYTSTDGAIYELALCKAVIHRIASESSKGKPALTKQNKKIEFIVAKDPNDFMTTSQFFYRLATIYEIENNAFIVPIENEFGHITGIYPVCPSQAVMKELNGVVYIVYTFADGHEKAIEYNRCGHLKKMQYKNDFFGDSNRAFNPTADLVKAQETGTQQAIQNGSNLRFIGKLNSEIVDEEDMKEQQQAISTMNLSGNNTGVFLYDNRFESMEQIKAQAVLLDADQKKAIENSVFNYWGVNEHILQNNYDENEWNAFYESKVEAFFIQAGEVLTRMFYSRDQRERGNEILLTSDRLQYASNTTKIQVAKEYFDRGLITTNQALSILNMPPVEDGDKRYIRAEYLNITDNVGKGVTDGATGNANKNDDNGSGEDGGQ